jgi:hypothetical protein
MQSKRAKAVLGVALVAAAVVLFVLLSGGDDDGDSDSGPQLTTASEGKPGKPKTGKPKPPTLQTIAVAKGAKPAGGVQELDFTSGERVRFRVTSDEKGEVHVHGYEITKPVKAGGSVSFDFHADLEGGYEVELHHAGGETPIAELTVQPG